MLSALKYIPVVFLIRTALFVAASTMVPITEEEESVLFVTHVADLLCEDGDTSSTS
jgi:hypothetical protein